MKPPSARTAVLPWGGISEEEARGANLRIVKEGGKTTMYYVSAFGDTVLHYAANRGFKELTRFLLSQYDVDVNAFNNFGERPLLHPCRAGHSEIAELLLDRGANASLLTLRNETSLHWLWAFEKSDRGRLAKRLIDGGASRCEMASYPEELQLAFGSTNQVRLNPSQSILLRYYNSLNII